MGKMNTPPQILLTNDDGFFAPGLIALYEALSPVGACTVVAPVSECSAVGHAITMRKPIRIQKSDRGFKGFGWAVDGTPADCVKFAVKKVLRSVPDLIVAGINQGANTAINTIYSGTVAGAAEGGIMNVPAFAISVTSYEYNDFSSAAEFAQIIAKKILENGLPDHTFLNINVPPVPREQIAGIRITHQGKTRYDEIFDELKDPSNNTYFWLRGEKIILEHSEDSDEIAVENNYIAVTPLQCDLTNYNALDYLRKWKISLE